MICVVYPLETFHDNIYSVVLIDFKRELAGESVTLRKLISRYRMKLSSFNLIEFKRELARKNVTLTKLISWYREKLS